MRFIKTFLLSSILATLGVVGANAASEGVDTFQRGYFKDYEEGRAPFDEDMELYLKEQRAREAYDRQSPEERQRLINRLNELRDRYETQRRWDRYDKDSEARTKPYRQPTP